MQQTLIDAQHYTTDEAEPDTVGSNPLLLHTNPDSHVKTARPHQNSAAFVKVNTSSSRQTGFSMDESKARREGHTLDQRETLQRT